MKRIDFSADHAEPIAHFGSSGAHSKRLADGSGQAHIYSLHFEPGGQIGPHPTGFGQLFLVVAGAGWASGPDGKRVELVAGQGVYFARGELHAKGSQDGMTAIMIQVDDLEVTAVANI